MTNFTLQNSHIKVINKDGKIISLQVKEVFRKETKEINIGRPFMKAKSYYTRELEYRMLSIPLNRLELVNQNPNSKISLQQKSTGLFLNVKCSATYVNIYIN